MCEESLKPDEENMDVSSYTRWKQIIVKLVGEHQENYLSLQLYYPDKFVRRDIDALEVTCLHKATRCGWEGTLGQLEVTAFQQGYHMLMICNFTM